MRTHRLSVRTWLEIVGTALLLVGIWTQRAVLGRSLHVIADAKLVPLLLGLCLTWLLFLWSALGYRVLLQKPVSTHLIYLAHLAAGGPGRVIPGGAGHVSFGTLFLKKQGLRTPQALAVSLSNNLTGLVVNIALLWVLFIARPSLLTSLHVSERSLLIGGGVALAVTALIVLARRSRRFNRSSTSTWREVKKEWLALHRQPYKIDLLVLLVLATMITNALILYLSAQAVSLQLPLTTAFVAVSTGVALGGVLPTPGGVGGVEAGLIACLYALGYTLELATSAALLYRAATYVLPFLPGVAAYLWLRRKKLL